MEIITFREYSKKGGTQQREMRATLRKLSISLPRLRLGHITDAYLA